MTLQNLTPTTFDFSHCHPWRETQLSDFAMAHGDVPAAGGQDPPPAAARHGHRQAAVQGEHLCCSRKVCCALSRQMATNLYAIC